MNTKSPRFSPGSLPKCPRFSPGSFGCPRFSPGSPPVLPRFFPHSTPTVKISSLWGLGTSNYKGVCISTRKGHPWGMDASLHSLARCEVLAWLAPLWLPIVVLCVHAWCYPAWLPTECANRWCRLRPSPKMYKAQMQWLQYPDNPYPLNSGGGGSPLNQGGVVSKSTCFTVSFGSCFLIKGWKCTP